MSGYDNAKYNSLARSEEEMNISKQHAAASKHTMPQTMQQPIDEATTELTNCIRDLRQSFEDLVSKIYPVLTPDYETKDPGSAMDDVPAASPLLKLVRDEIEYVNEFAVSVRAVIRRVEC